MLFSGRTSKRVYKVFLLFFSMGFEAKVWCMKYLQWRKAANTWACVCVQVLSCVWLFATLWTVARQAPLPMGLSGKNTGVGCHALLQGIFPTQGLKLCPLHLLHWQAGSLPEAPLGKLLGRSITRTLLYRKLGVPSGWIHRWVTPLQQFVIIRVCWNSLGPRIHLSSYV